MDFEKRPRVQPRIIIHGGAGNITRKNLPPEVYDAYSDFLLDVLRDSNARLQAGETALDIATHAVSRLEDCSLFNAGHGAVYTTAGTHELEASVMVSRGCRKRGVGVMNVGRTRNPIKLAREMLVRGEEQDGGGAGGHSQLQGQVCDDLAQGWGLEMVQPSYFWTKKRWQEHRKGLGKPYDDDSYEREKCRADEVEDEHMSDGLMNHVISAESTAGDKNPSWNGTDYLPQGTVGAVALDSTGTICAATSTGGLTNKLPGRVGDTPTIGAGFWAEEWHVSQGMPDHTESAQGLLSATFKALVGDCFPALSDYTRLPNLRTASRSHTQTVRAVGMSGTGNGDSFLRTDAVRTAAAIARFSGITASSQARAATASQSLSLQQGVSMVAGPHGMLQRSAEDRWQKTGEGEGGIIGIELDGGEATVVFDFNCGGMWHAWVDDQGEERIGVFQDNKWS